MLFSPVFVTLHLRFALPPREPHFPASAATASWAISTEPNCRPSPNNSRSGTQFATPNTPTPLKFFLFTFLRTLLQFFAPAKNSTLLFQAIPHSLDKNTGWGYSSHQKAGKSLASAILSSPEDPFLEVAKSILLILTALFPIVNPLGGSPVFFALTREYPHPVRRILARHVAL